MRITEGLFLEGGVDPRVILSLIPLLREEVIEGAKGIWIHSGLIPVVERYRILTPRSFETLTMRDTLDLIKRYLGAWRQRKGFGSIADEIEVFQTVDAALLRLLLEQDGQDASRPNKPSPTRIELYALVDSGVDCFDRAIALLEQYKRLFVLSRLYQSRRMARKVLEVWRRIIEGDADEGGGLVDGEAEVRRYLVNIKDTALVDEYGTWLARRNPSLGVQVFTNDSSRVKWEPHQVVMLLRRKAPDAVKVYLEHLVFGKKNVQYANDLISYYLDSVLTVLGSSEEARNILSQSYESYRALHPPKPTYRQFIIENAVPLPWWHDRLRLLELIGGSHGSDFSYDVENILSRIEPFEEDLVPESIILDGRQGRHKQALRLLTHGLGDYHTAVNYCLLGGASIFHPTTGSAALIAPSQDEQAVLFGYLLTEFLRIEDVGDRLERTSELLERFGSWYDVRDVLELIPESWSVELVSGFLVSSFRRLVHERNEATITKALSGAENLQIAAAFVEKCSAIGPRVEEVP
ncbi:vacuolar protein sorting-associated protein 3, partial [Lecanoromycetidae sp. Uapishka_2]